MMLPSTRTKPKAKATASKTLPDIPWIADNGLRVVNRTNQSIHLSWLIHDDTPVLDSSQDLSIGKDGKGFFGGTVNENWYEVQMNTIGSGNEDWTTVYKGFKTECRVTNLTPDANVQFRMKKNTDSYWGTSVTAATDVSPPNADDLHRAISLHAEDMVLRIIGGTMRHNYTGPSIRHLVASHDRNGLTPLMNACQDGHISLVSTLLQVGADVDAVAVWNKKTALMCACASGHADIAQMLSKCKADWTAADRNGCTALHHAVTSGNTRVVEIAIDNSPHKLLTQYDTSGWTPILRAVIVGESPEVLKVLLRHGADPNSVDKLKTKSCLMAAVTMGKTEMVSELINFGADPNFKNPNKKTILDVAVGSASKEISEMVALAVKNVQLFGERGGAGLLRQRHNPYRVIKK